MSILTDLKAALDAIDVARKNLAKPLPISEVAYLEREEALYSALGTYYDLLTDDTIRALLDVAGAAEAHSAEFPATCDGDWMLPITCLHRTLDDLRAALAPLVKEEEA